MDANRAPWWQRVLLFLPLVPAAVVTNGTLYSLGIVALALIFVKASRRPTLALRSTRWERDIVLGSGAGALLWIFSHFLMDPGLETLFGRIDVESFETVRGDLTNYLVLLALGFIYGGMIEEIIFRGFVIGWGTTLFGDKAAVPLLLLSTVVFSFAHWYQGLAGVISTGVAGLTFGMIYLLAGRRLLPAILTHMTVDAIGITALYLGYRP